MQRTTLRSFAKNRHASAWHRRAVAWIACVTGLALAPMARATADAPLLPTEPLRDYYAEERAAGAERSQALCAALLHLAARSEDPVQRIELLAHASRMDPTRVEPHLRRAQALAGRRDLGGAVLALREAFAALPLDAVESARWVRLAQRGAHDVLLTALWVCVGVLALRTLPFVRHRLSARSPHGLQLTMLVVSPFAALALASPTWGALVAAGALTPLLRRSERGVLAALCILAAAVDLLLQPLAPQAMLLDASSTSAVLARANYARADRVLVESLKQTLGQSPERDLVLGLQAARARDWGAAKKYYSAAVQANPTWSLPYVDLANVFYTLGDHQRAASGYRTALQYPPETAHVHANLAQTYIAMLQFDLADDEMNAATALEFETSLHQRAAWQRHEAPVFDVLLPAETIRFVARAEVEARPDRAQALLQTWRGRGWEHLPRHIAPWALFATALVLALPWRLPRLADACGRCGRMCCPHCFSTDTEPSAMCAACIAGDPTRPRRAKALLRRTADDTPAWAASWIASMFPGAAFLLRGRPVVALPTVLLGSIALLGLTDVAEAMRTNPGTWLLHGGGAARLAAIVFVCAYLPGLLHLRRHLFRRPFRRSGA
jgi:tetratricopeptide (TPR) repeat protein